MNTYPVLLVLFFLVFSQVLVAEGESVSIRKRVTELMLRDLEKQATEVITLEPFTVRASAVGDSPDIRIYTEVERYLEKEKLRQNSGLFDKIHLPFSLNSVETGSDERLFIPNASTFREVHGGIRLSDNATLYIKTGVLWGSDRKGKMQFYLPFRYRSSVGIGWKKRF